MIPAPRSRVSSSASVPRAGAPARSRRRPPSPPARSSTSWRRWRPACGDARKGRRGGAQQTVPQPGPPLRLDPLHPVSAGGRRSLSRRDRADDHRAAGRGARGGRRGRVLRGAVRAGDERHRPGRAQPVLRGRRADGAAGRDVRRLLPAGSGGARGRCRGAGRRPGTRRGRPGVADRAAPSDGGCCQLARQPLGFSSATAIPGARSVGNTVVARRRSAIGPLVELGDEA